MKEIKVLDHGYVRLVDSMGSDLSIVRAARVSYAADWRAGEDEGSDERLIGYLMRNRHTSPFEDVKLAFEVKLPIFVARQWMRHRTWSYNEVSARYSELDEGFYVPDENMIGAQSKVNKQARSITEHNPYAKWFVNALREATIEAIGFYKDALEAGIPRELARLFLPVNTYTRMRCSVDLHNLMKFIELRLSPDAQYEIACYADALVDLAKTVVPVSINKFLTERRL